MMPVSAPQSCLLSSVGNFARTCSNPGCHPGVVVLRLRFARVVLISSLERVLCEPRSREQTKMNRAGAGALSRR